MFLLQLLLLLLLQSICMYSIQCLQLIGPILHAKVHVNLSKMIYVCLQQSLN